MQVLDLTEGVIGFEITWSIVDLDRLVITGILIDELDVILLLGKIICVIPKSDLSMQICRVTSQNHCIL